ncbi:hypothetical protein MHA_1020 [Mannheimia haemolytica PHL213]|nr:hypothetical protein MHA_1020 [Mannheimia haemolytica PHL213]
MTSFFLSIQQAIKFMYKLANFKIKPTACYLT